MAEIPSIFNRYNHALDGELEQTLSRRQGLLYNMMLYQLGWADAQGSPLSKPDAPRLHPTLCLISCEVLSGDYRPALPAAAGLELLNTFTLVHADVQDGSPQSGERPSVWWVWGPGQAINVGDGLHALGRTALFRLGERDLPPGKVLKALEVLDEACIRTCEGQYMDMTFQERVDLSVSAYLKMVEGKTSALMSCAMELGALIATDSQRVIEAFRLCGRKLGIAFQIREDILGLWAGVENRSPSSEVFNKKKGFPIIRLLEQGDLKTKRQLGAIYFKRVLEPPDVQEMLTLLEEADARKWAQAAAESYLQEAMVALEGLDLPSGALEQIAELGRYIVNRSK